MGEDTEVCVIGAGPAGLALTLMLLRSGAKVTLVERATGFDREFRGEILQPGGQAVLASLGVLDAVRARGACRLDRFQLVDGDRTLLDIDYRRLPKPHDHLLAAPQRHLLVELLAACREHEGFEYLDGHRVSELLRDGDRYTGAVVTGNGKRAITAKVVVGADGRYSKTRSLAGIDAGRHDAFDQDVLWFKLFAPGRQQGRVVVHRRAGSMPVLVHDSHPDRLQIGWTLPHKGWRLIADQGIEHVREQLMAALPQFADLIAEQVTALSDLMLLDVFSGRAPEWVRDGLVLLGDSAHTHSPIGAQGINLALQDAAVLHPVLLEVLASSDSSAERLRPYVDQRGPVVDGVLKLQRMQAKGMLGSSNPVADAVRPAVAKLISRTPIGVKITNRIAYGRAPVAVRTDLFQ